MGEGESKVDVKKARKPAPGHPWKKFVRTEVAEWAREKSKTPEPNNWKVGGGRDAWNK